MLYDYVTQPGYVSCGEIDPAREEENLHWCDCKLRKDERGAGCEKCVVVAKRVPDRDRVMGRWNDRVY